MKLSRERQTLSEKTLEVGRYEDYISMIGHPDLTVFIDS
jgi:hypothetical protein